MRDKGIRNRGVFMARLAIDGAMYNDQEVWMTGDERGEL
jgi:hypothetical protein